MRPKIALWPLLTTGVALDDNEKTPCPRMNQETFVPSDIISSTESVTGLGSLGPFQQVSITLGGFFYLVNYHLPTRS